MEENVELCENSSIWSEKAAKTPLSDINTGQQCYSKKNQI